MSISATMSSIFSKKLVQKIGSKVIMEGNEDKRISELTVFIVTYIILLLLCHASWTTLPAKMENFGGRKCILSR